jgi:hypothetical protein
MDTLRLERVLWSLALGGVLATFLALLLLPDPTGVFPVVAVGLASLVAVPLVYAFLARTESTSAHVGDLTVRWVTLFAVVAGLRVLFGAVGFDGVVSRVVSLALGFLAATRARRWNPLRARGGASA